MRRRVSSLAAAVAVSAAIYLAGHQWVSAQQRGTGPANAVTRVAAVPSEKGGQDIFGAYEVVAGWPKKLSTIPGHGPWTFGAGQSVFAESPDRVYVVQRGELPEIPRPMTTQTVGPRGRASRSRSAGCRGGMRPPPALRATAAAGSWPRAAWRRGRGPTRWASTPAGSTASWCSTARATCCPRRRTGCSGTRACSGRTSSPSARTMRTRTSGSSTTTST